MNLLQTPEFYIAAAGGAAYQNYSHILQSLQVFIIYNFKKSPAKYRYQNSLELNRYQVWYLIKRLMYKNS